MESILWVCGGQIQFCHYNCVCWGGHPLPKPRIRNIFYVIGLKNRIHHSYNFRLFAGWDAVFWENLLSPQCRGSWTILITSEILLFPFVLIHFSSASRRTKTRENGSENRFLSRVISAAKRECEPYTNWMRPAPTWMIR